MEVLFLRKEEVLDLQAQGIDTFGGLPGLRDEGALDSALLAPQQRAFYEGAAGAIARQSFVRGRVVLVQPDAVVHAEA
ncbi:MAG: hypothetical protein IPJ58_13855 [Ardenticatenia bacterium]|nr:hypothetical protein [Ardenticatenia bacterium]